MTFTLHVDGDRWRAHTRSDPRRRAHRDRRRRPTSTRTATSSPSRRATGTASATRAWCARRRGSASPGSRSARCSRRPAAADAYDGDILVHGAVRAGRRDRGATPGRALERAARTPARVVRTVSSPAAWKALVARADGSPARLHASRRSRRSRRWAASASPRDELLGMLAATTPARDAIADGRIRLEGLALHLPLAEPHTDHRTDPGARWHDSAVAPAPPAGRHRARHRGARAGASAGSAPSPTSPTGSARSRPTTPPPG